MFDRFTDRAREAMGFARRAAQRFQHEVIAPEHILLGITEDHRCMAVRALKARDVDIRALRSGLEQHMSRGTRIVSTGQIPFTPSAKRTLEASLEEAYLLGHSHIGSEHLLLALFRDDGTVGHVLRALPITVEDLRKEVARLVPPPETPHPDPRLEATARALADRTGLSSRAPGTLYSSRVTWALFAALREAVAASHATTPLDLLRGAIECVAPVGKDLALLAREVEAASQGLKRGDSERGRWAPAAHAVLGAAHVLAAKRGAERVGISDLFDALVEDESVAAAKTLEAAGLSLTEVRAWVGNSLEPDAEPRKPGG